MSNIEPINPREQFDENDILPELTEEICSICYENLTLGETYKLPECGHEFHSNCIIPWFRRNNVNCPYCRTDPEKNINDNYYNINAKYSFNRAFSRKKNAPQNLKKIVERLKKFEKKIKDENKKMKNWRASKEGLEWKRLKKIFSKIRPKTYTHYRKKREFKHQIACYPIVPVHVAYYNKKKRKIGEINENEEIIIEEEMSE